MFSFTTSFISCKNWLIFPFNFFFLDKGISIFQKLDFRIGSNLGGGGETTNVIHYFMLFMISNLIFNFYNKSIIIRIQKNVERNILDNLGHQFWHDEWFKKTLCIENVDTQRPLKWCITWPMYAALVPPD